MTPARYLATVLILSALAAPVTADAPSRPNIILIVADDLGWADVGYHDSEIKTPTLDRLAAAGARLEHFYSLPVCRPARAALMTGRYPVRYGLEDGNAWPDGKEGVCLARERYLGEALQSAGYHTVICGKWHLGNHQLSQEKRPRRGAIPCQPLQRGFLHHYGPYRGTIDSYDHTWHGRPHWFRDGEPLVEKGYVSDLLADESVRVIERHDTKQPLFLMLSFTAPHVPLQAPDEYIQRYAAIDDEKRRVYAAMVTSMDDAIGRVVQAVERRGLMENTLFFFCSDNGANRSEGGSNQPLRGGKSMVQEGGVRVPAFAYWKGRIKPRVVTQPLHIVDVFPTLVGLAGGSVEQPQPLDGRDMFPALAQGKPVAHDYVLLSGKPSARAIRGDQWKLVIKRTNKRAPPTVRLYDVVADPGEQLDRSDEHPDIVESLRKQLNACLRPPTQDADGRSAPNRKRP